ncbi:MAG: hypothetical protein KIT58_02495 [Planctomycetota bacterium]|nr:hypothetical protein [Planctomycetota bacterium]
MVPIADAVVLLPRSALDWIEHSLDRIAVAPGAEFSIAIVPVSEWAATKIQFFSAPPDLGMVKVIAGESSVIVLVGADSRVKRVAALASCVSRAGRCTWEKVPTERLSKLKRNFARDWGEHCVVGGSIEEWIGGPPADHPSVALRYIMLDDGVCVVYSLWALRFGVLPD